MCEDAESYKAPEAHSIRMNENLPVSSLHTQVKDQGELFEIPWLLEWAAAANHFH